ncbi:MAG: hypothetical protein HY963_07645 [Ignavibacteriales bacterium]|nr:hypothetical protein [Ignavibacteriales bacterium]
MKKTIILITALFIFMSIELDAKPSFGVSFNFFYSSLRSYGEWIQLDNDLVVWRPHGIHSRWRPYSEGRWSWTSNGWYWDSYEPFGWATYHYGRWYNDDYYGWIWIPDYDWAPAWVEWRYDDDYIGWAPLPPYARFEINFGIHFSIGWHSHYSYWNFVNYNRFCDHRLNYYLLNERRIARIFESTRYRTNYYYDRDRIINGGVDKSFIERKAGYRIAEREITSIDNYRDYDRVRSERGDKVYAYRPSEKEINNDRTDKFEIRRGENHSTIEREKVATSIRRDSNRELDQSNERTVERNRDMNVDRDRNIREETRSKDDARKELERIQYERTENRDRQRIESKGEERINREIQRERQPIYERPSRSERPQVQERRVEPRKEQNNDRPMPRVESRGRSEERSPSKERSSERKK